MRQEEIDHLLSDKVQIWKPDKAAETMWKTLIRSGGGEELVNFFSRTTEAIIQGKDTGLFSYSQAYQEWKRIADEGYQGAGASDVYHSPYIDGPRPFTKAEYMQQWAKALIYGTGGDLIRGGWFNSFKLPAPAANP